MRRTRAERRRNVMGRGSGKRETNGEVEMSSPPSCEFV
jgi:hypothetical protein